MKIQVFPSKIIYADGSLSKGYLIFKVLNLWGLLIMYEKCSNPQWIDVYHIIDV